MADLTPDYIALRNARKIEAWSIAMSNERRVQRDDDFIANYRIPKEYRIRDQEQTPDESKAQLGDDAVGKDVPEHRRRRRRMADIDLSFLEDLDVDSGSAERFKNGDVLPPPSVVSQQLLGQGHSLMQ